MNLRPNDALVLPFKIVVLVSLLVALVAISQSSTLVSDDLIKTALAIDFIFTVPIVYFFLIKRTAIPQITVVPVFLTSFGLASMLLPNGNRLMSVAGSILVPAVEFIVFGYLVFRIYRGRKAYLDEADQGFDFIERLRNAFVRVLKPPFVARATAFEVAVFAYAFLIWRRPKSGFSYHRTDGPLLVLGVFLFLILAETIGLHFLLAMWSEILAWIATALSIYFIVQIAADLKALYLRPIVVMDSSLLLRCGILGDAVICRDNIESAETVNGTRDTTAFSLLPLGGMSQPNVQLTLIEPVTVFGVYGSKTSVSNIFFRVDDPGSFIRAIKL